MNKFKYFFVLLIAGVSLVSCSNNDDDIATVPPRDYAEQYAVDKVTIETYLNTHYVTVTADMDIAIDSIEDPTKQVSIMSYEANVGTTTFPQLKTRIVNLYGVNFDLHYLVLREGVGESPMNTDGILTAYSGSYLTNVAAKEPYDAYVGDTFFEEVKYPQSFSDLTGLIKGWGETFPEFKTGTSMGNQDGTVVYSDFGAGVMFLPSALGYYNQASGSIPTYSPLVFSFKLYQIKRLDHDYDIVSGSLIFSPDGVPDYLEDINRDGYVYDYRNTTLYPTPPATNPDDTDKDGIPDYLDIDDDGDRYTTKLEITKPVGEAGPSRYYPYDAFTPEDDPATPTINESVENKEPRGIPAFAASGAPDYISPERLRLHLDKEHHTAKPE